MASNSAGGEQSRSEYKQKHAFDFVLVFEIWSYAMSCPQPQKKYCISLLRQKKRCAKFWMFYWRGLQNQESGLQ